MYHHLSGRLVEVGHLHVVVEVSGVGYLLQAPLSTIEVLRGQEEVAVFTHLLVREDDLRLFGFATEAERDLFRLVSSVSGVGPATALAALSTLTVEQLILALETGDAGAIQTVKGVGKKLAERLALELRDRARHLRARRATSVGAGDVRPTDELAPEARLLEDACAVLVELGFQRKDAEKRVGKCLRGREGALPSVEDAVREALAASRS